MFNEFHIPQAINIQLENLKNNFDNYNNIFLRDKKIFVVCNRGYSSLDAVMFLKNFHINAYSIKGGMMEWSNQNLPRIKNQICKNLVDKNKLTSSST